MELCLILFFIRGSQDFNKKIQNEKGKKGKDLNFNKLFWYLINNDNEIITLFKKTNKPLLNLEGFNNYIKSLNNGIGSIYILKEGNIINGANFNKIVNVSRNKEENDKKNHLKKLLI